MTLFMIITVGAVVAAAAVMRNCFLFVLVMNECEAFEMNSKIRTTVSSEVAVIFSLANTSLRYSDWGTIRRH